MIDLRTPLSEREPLDVIELAYYQRRLTDDGLTKAMEKIQAAVVEVLSLVEQPGPGQLQAQAASQSLREAYSLLSSQMQANQTSMKGLASYLKLNEVELFGTMKELFMAQKAFEELDAEENPNINTDKVTGLELSPDMVQG